MDAPGAAGGFFRIERLLRPASVAVIGRSAAGAQVLATLRAGGFAGRLDVVETAAELAELADLPILASLGASLGTDLAALGRAGAPAALVLAPAPLPALMVRSETSATPGVPRVLGPGSFGIAAPALGLQAIHSHLPAPPGRVALVGQSAALMRAVLDWAAPNGVGFSHVVGIGGNTDIGFAPVLDHLARDSETTLILLDIRRIRNRRAFLSAARAAARLRPVVALRAGSRLLDPSGAADAAFAAALRRAGILSVAGFEDFLAAAETLTRARPARGEALAIVTNAIGPGQMAADAALRAGLDLAALAPERRQALELALPPAQAGQMPARGPVYVGLDQPMRLAEAAAMLAAVPQIGGVLAIHTPSPGGGDAAAIAGLAACAGTLSLPLLACVMGETSGAAYRQQLAAAGVAAFASPEQAVRGFVHLVQHRRVRAAARELPPRATLRLHPERARVAALFAAWRKAGRQEALADEALAVLSAYGIPVLPTRRAMDAEDAVAAAALLGFPVTLRLCAPDATEARGDLHDAGELRHAAGALARRAPALAGQDAAQAGFLVQRQIGRARALAILLAEDAMFGPTIGLGASGAAPGDCALDLPPLNLPLAQALVAAAGLIDPAFNHAAVAETLVRVSQLLVDFPEIGPLRIDPLFVDAEGVMAGDARLALRPPEAPAVLAILPYPAELQAPWEGGGERLLIRPIRPEDAEAHAAFFGRLRPEDVRYRFFSAMRALSAEQVARMTQVDYAREMAFIAVREATGETVGVARLVREMDTPAAEFAVVVEPAMQHRGLAEALMRRLIAWGRQQGIGEIVGDILADNAGMIAFVRRLGFHLVRRMDQDGLLEARLSLAPERTD